jgi:hypothetical protein
MEKECQKFTELGLMKLKACGDSSRNFHIGLVYLAKGVLDLLAAGD